MTTLRYGCDGLKYVDPSFDCLKFIQEHRPDEYANIETGEIKYPIKLKDGPITILILKKNKSGRLYLKLQGSIHSLSQYLQTGISNNHGAFTINDTKEVIDYLQNKYGINSKEGHLENLEFNFTFETSFDPADFIKNRLFLYEEKSHSKYLKEGRFVLKEFEYSEYSIKIYVKVSLLRIEIRFKRNSIIRRQGIKTLADLANPININNVHKTLISKINELTILDLPKLPSIATEKEKDIFDTFISEHRLKVLRANYSRTTVGKKKKLFKWIFKKYNLDKTKKEILSKVNESHGFHNGEMKYQKSERLTDLTIHVSEKCKPMVNKESNIFYLKRPPKRDDPQTRLRKGKIVVFGPAHHEYTILRSPRNSISNSPNNEKNRFLKNLSETLSTQSLFPIDEIINFEMIEENQIFNDHWGQNSSHKSHRYHPKHQAYEKIAEYKRKFESNHSDIEVNRSNRHSI